jgi:hypothetical protein
MTSMTSTLLDLATLARDIGKEATPRIFGSRQLLRYPDWTRAEVDDLAFAIRVAVDETDAMEDPIAIEGTLPTWVLSRLSCELWPMRLLVRTENGTPRLVEQPHLHPGGFGRGIAWYADLRAEHALLEIRCANDASLAGSFLAPKLPVSGLLTLRASSQWLTVCHALAYRSHSESVAVDEGPLGVVVVTSRSGRYAVGQRLSN